MASNLDTFIRRVSFSVMKKVDKKEKKNVKSLPSCKYWKSGNEDDFQCLYCTQKECIYDIRDNRKKDRLLAARRALYRPRKEK